MKNKLNFKGFIGTVNFSVEDGVYFGKIEGVNDLVTFEGSTGNELKSAFEEAVEDYVDLKLETG